MFKSVTVEKQDGVAMVTMVGPGKGNAMGPDFWEEMPKVFAGLDADEATRAVLVRGQGNAFSYGLDLPGMMGTLGPLLSAPGAAERTQLLDLILRMQEAFNAVARCRKPVVAAIHGWCIGGAVDLISACDVRLCSADAKFSVREVKLAIVADMGSLQRLPRIIGQGATRELAFTGKDFDAARAQRVGLVNDVFETPDALFVAARTMAREIASNPPLTVQGIKRVLGQETERVDADNLRQTAVWNAAFLPSMDLAEAMAAFMERRAPTFQGK
jgi:enoyl-CoA hydratase